MDLPEKYNLVFINHAKEHHKPYFNAEPYGVQIVPVANPSQPHWRIIGVHHMTNEETAGKINAYCDILDENGQRVKSAFLMSKKGDLEPDKIKLEKPDVEPATNVPMFAHDSVTLWVEWPENASLPSERVTNLKTEHPDEGTGITLYHHAFYIVFQKTAGNGAQPASPPAEQPDIGTVPPPTLVPALWAAGEPHLIPLNREAGLYKVAQQMNLGERLSDEYEVLVAGQNYVAQIYELGLVYAAVPHWNQIQVSLRPRGLDGPAPAIFWDDHITGFGGNRGEYWDLYLEGKVPSLTRVIFKDGVLVHNPDLEQDGWVFRAAKSYKMPRGEGQPAAPSDQPAVRVNQQNGTEVVAAATLIEAHLAAAISPPIEVAGGASQKIKVGLHFSNKLWERPGPQDFELLRLTQPTCIKTCLFADNPNFDQADLHRQLHEEHPQALIVARLFAPMGEQHWPAQEFIERFKAKIEAVRPYVSWFEVHNEPNIDRTQAGYGEGFGHTDQDFQTFRTWVNQVLDGLQLNHPWAKWVFPGNAIHNYYEFWLALIDTIPRFDAWGIHCYWQEDRHIDPVFGRCYERAHALLPQMPLIITEWGDSTLGRSPAEKTPVYQNWLREVSQQSYIMGTGLYILGGTQDWINRPGIPNFDVTRDMAIALGQLNAPTTRDIPLPAAWPLLTDGFDFPVGKPDGQDYYVAAGLVEPSYFAERGDWHTGEDWSRRRGPGDTPDVDLGDPVYAVANGRVVTSQSFPTWGNILLLEHRLPWGQTVWSQYAHLKDRYVQKGEVIRRGDQIGTIGKGDAERYPAHLHFEIRLRELPASKWGLERVQVLRAYAYPSDFIRANRSR